MSDTFKKAPTGGGSYFKHAERVNDLAIILEPRRIRRNIDGKFGPRDLVYADVAIFANSDDVTAKTPSTILKGAEIDAKVLVKIIDENGWLDDSGPALVTVGKPAGKNYYSFGDVTYPGAEEAAVEWFSKREAELAQNLADAPDFD